MNKSFSKIQVGKQTWLCVHNHLFYSHKKEHTLRFKNVQCSLQPCPLSFKTIELDIEELIDIGCLAMEIILSKKFMIAQFEDNQFIPSMTSKPKKASI